MNRRTLRTLAAMTRDGRMPDKYAPLVTEASPERAHRGQVLIMFAGFMLAMMGMLGLATDVGYAMAARRAAQGAADAGAIAGARVIARYKSSSPTSAQGEVNTIVADNTFGSTKPTVAVCEYIGSNWQPISSCNSTVPSNAAGVRVKTRMTVSTFFIQVLPGVSNTYSVTGYAKARVQRADVSSLAAQAPFIVCGDTAWDVTSNPNGSGGSTMSIVSSKSPFKLNQNAVGRIFRIHDPQLAQKGADCKSKGARFKGLADQKKNGQKTAPDWFYYDTGTKAGPTRAKVNGAEGCALNTQSPYNCVMILPVATNNPAESGNSKQVYVVGYAAFKVTRVDANSHNGQLLGEYFLGGVDGSDDWTVGSGGPVIIRLIW